MVEPIIPLTRAKVFILPLTREKPYMVYPIIPLTNAKPFSSH